MTFEVSFWNGGDETDVLGVVDSRDEARDIIREYAKTLIVLNHNVPYLTVDFAYNSVSSAMGQSRINHISEDFDGNWTLIWYPEGCDGCKDKFFFVHEE